MDDALRYPIGDFEPPEALDPGDRERLIRQIEALRRRLGWSGVSKA